MLATLGSSMFPSNCELLSGAALFRMSAALGSSMFLLDCEALACSASFRLLAKLGSSDCEVLACSAESLFLFWEEFRSLIFLEEIGSLMSWLVTAESNSPSEENSWSFVVSVSAEPE